MTRPTDALDRVTRPVPHGAGRSPSREGGLTMIELVVVISVLVIVAGIAMARLEGTEEHAGRRVTAATLRTLQGAILGTPTQPGYLTDVREMPNELHDLLLRPAGVDEYDRVSRSGWNGPYLQPTGAKQVIAGGVGGVSVYEVPVIRDGWRRPVMLQKPDGPQDTPTKYWRLVSAGPNGAIDTSQDVSLLDPTDESDVGDDLVLYLTWIPGTAP